MIRADLDELLVLSRLFPAWTWAALPDRNVIVAADADAGVLRPYWMPALLCMDTHLAAKFVLQLNSE
ncbi:hypothetical protein [Pseudomonas sp. GOM6]|uniref:hypothetical protein n=1 Tax=Pseudomonas sp. GOM6 TaxID=3036944 RepID=UPI00240A03B3|nr:hypothetical protein [Pseudomonas sp. GOM6]MDG1580947.1 hypothetical protein [Pseudomonas sp. GOM6]